ncbi:MAG: hypothetical protein AAF828_01735 [Bacteroidota bacterium]
MRITEQDIRRLSIGRLRLYYKTRPRREWDGINIIDKAHYYKNITIDARLTYVEPDGQRFIATVEASSLDKRAEVDFRFNWFRWLAESLVLTLGTIAFVLILTQVQGFNVIHSKYIGGFWSWLLFFGLMLWGFYAFAIGVNLRRYRYIYAIEQFKQFYANDQWIAISADIYPNHTGRKWRELQRQCIRYGFGLLQVELDRSVRILIAPKRGDFFEGNRRQLPTWVRRIEQAPVIGRLLPPAEPAPAEVQADPLLLDPLSTVDTEEVALLPAPVEPRQVALAKKGAPTLKSAPVKATRQWWQHFRWLLRSLFRPKVVKRLPGYFYLPLRWWLPGLLSFLVSGGILYLQGQVTDVATLEDSSAAWPIDELEETRPGRKPPFDPEYEAELNDFYSEKRSRSVAPYTLEDELTAAPISPSTNEKDLDLVGTDSDVYFYRIEDRDTTVLFNCPRLPRAGEDIYALVYRQSSNFEEALQTAFHLHHPGGPIVTVAKADCLRAGRPGYVVYLDEIMGDERRVNFLFRKYTRGLKLELEIMAL